MDQSKQVQLLVRAFHLALTHTHLHTYLPQQHIPQAGAPMVPSKCKPAPGPAPPPPPHATTNALIWPLPTKYTRGTTTLQVTVPDAAKFFSTAQSSDTTPFVTQAFARYADLCFSHRTSASAADASAGAITGLVVTLVRCSFSERILHLRPSLKAR
jgi:hypothetical protein